MITKPYPDAKILRETYAHLYDGLDVEILGCNPGILDKTYSYWQNKFGWMGPYRFLKKGALEKNERLKKIVAELHLNKMILKESSDN